MSASPHQDRQSPAASGRRPEAARSWEQAAWAAAVFCALVAVFMILGHLGARESDPWKSPQLLKLKAELKEAPKDEAIKQRIRELDLEFRGRYFTQLSRKETGSLFLIGGASVFVVAMLRRQKLGSGPYLPGTRPLAIHSREAAAPSRWTVAATGMAMGGLMFGLSVWVTNAVPRSPDHAEKLFAAQKAKANVIDAATPEEMAANWPAFRGYQGAGFAPSANPPVKIDATSGEGIAWKVPSPVSGYNSPLVWGNRVFIAGGDAKKREVVCLDGDSGKVLWQTELANVPGTATKLPEIPESTGFAATTMATDGRRVYVFFANGDLGAFSFDGRVLWSRGFGSLENAYGHSSSLVTWQDRVFLQLDQAESDSGKSRLYSLDGRTGRVVWEKPRQFGASWASPILYEAGKPQLLTLSLPYAVAYHAVDGAELWRVECLHGEVCPSPAFAGGSVFVASPSDKLVSIRPDGSGDVTQTHVTWSMEEDVPDVSSPASNGELVFTISTAGVLNCFDAKDGKKLWTKDMEMDFHASPVIAGQRLYLFSQKGMVIVLEAGRELKELHRGELGDSFHATPAAVGDSLYVRGMQNLWRLGAPKNLAQAN